MPAPPGHLRGRGWPCGPARPAPWRPPSSFPCCASGADPRPGHDRRLRPGRSRSPSPASHAAAETSPSSRGRVGLHHGPRAPLRQSGAPAGGSEPATRSPSIAGSARPAPNARLQRALARLPRVGLLNRAPDLGPLALVPRALLRPALHPDPPPRAFPRAARRLAAVFDTGCAVYFAVPTAPPWWASEQGCTGPVRRIMVEVGEDLGPAWPRMYEALGGNPGRRCPR